VISSIVSRVHAVLVEVPVSLALPFGLACLLRLAPPVRCAAFGCARLLATSRRALADSPEINDLTHVSVSCSPGEIVVM